MRIPGLDQQEDCMSAVRPSTGLGKIIFILASALMPSPIFLVLSLSKDAPAFLQVSAPQAIALPSRGERELSS
jgi:hypothetical protein